MYKVIKSFKDLKQGRSYKVGDLYPAEGTKATKARIKELSTINNKHKTVFIAESGE